MCPFCGGWYAGASGIGLILSLLFLLLIIAGTGLLIWWIVRQSSMTRYAPPEQPSNRAVNTLNERYAKGEISKEEYEERKRVLTEK
ncbi:MAG: SHOCT domain-containing protein [Rubrobacteridae bacterium]|nr:SHOCT domain-containing protein [Rubrobacteridae bacterium]